MPRAWLVDVYETLLTVDFATVLRTAADHVGADVERFAQAAVDHDGEAMRSPTGMADVLPRLLLDCDVEPSADRLEWLRDNLPRLMSEHVTVFPDALDLLGRLRGAGSAVAIVSNCAEDTRPLLADHGLDRLVDALVLSCEVRSAKPEPAIFGAALDALGARAQDAVLLDDQARYCDGALAVGIDAVRVVRDGRVYAEALASGSTHPVVPDCTSLEP